MQEQAGVDEGGGRVVLEAGVFLGGDDPVVEADVLGSLPALGGSIGVRRGDVCDADFLAEDAEDVGGGEAGFDVRVVGGGTDVGGHC